MGIQLFGLPNPVGVIIYTLPSTYSLTSNVNSVAEGNPVVFTLTTTNVSNGTLVPFTITGVTGADIVGGQLTGNFTVNNNTASRTITVATDSITGELESLIMTIDGTNATKTVTITDTTPTYSLTSNVNSVIEGNSVIFTLTTTNISNGTQIPYTITGISGTDIQGGLLTGNFTVNSNTASVTITTLIDGSNEASESIVMTLNGNLASKSVTLLNYTQDTNYSSVSLLYHGEDGDGSTTFYDSSPSHFSSTRNASPVVSTARSRAGSGSIYFPGGTNADNSSRIIISTASSLFYVLDADFTIEFSLNITANSVRQSTGGVLGNRAAFIAGSNIALLSQAYGWWVIISGTATETGTGIQFSTWDGSNTQRRISWDFGGTLAKDTWYDLAIARTGSTWKAFINGAELTASLDQIGAFNFATGRTGNLHIGSNLRSDGTNNYSCPLNGYIDELRITKGVARYLSNYTPTLPFPDL